MARNGLCCADFCGEGRDLLIGKDIGLDDCRGSDSGTEAEPWWVRDLVDVEPSGVDSEGSAESDSFRSVIQEVRPEVSAL